MKIGVISDTHGVFSPEFRGFLDPVDEIWHAGDWGVDLAFTKTISDFKPVVGVCGNCDSRELLQDYPMWQSFERGGLKVLMTHIGGYPGHYSPEARALLMDIHPDIFVCGHSHILKVQWDERYKMMTMNPGAAGIQGWHVMRTALRFDIEGGEIKNLEVFNLPRN